MLRKRIFGFTLIELLITLLIISIAVVAAIWVFSDQVKRGRRVDGINALLSISLAEERYRSNNSTYGTLNQVWGGVTSSAEGYYTLAISNLSATTYTITATAVGNQATDTADGASCATLSLAVNAGTVTKSPAACWPD